SSSAYTSSVPNGTRLAISGHEIGAGSPLQAPSARSSRTGSGVSPDVSANAAPSDAVATSSTKPLRSNPVPQAEPATGVSVGPAATTSSGPVPAIDGIGPLAAQASMVPSGAQRATPVLPPSQAVPSSSTQIAVTPPTDGTCHPTWRPLASPVSTSGP